MTPALAKKFRKKPVVIEAVQWTGQNSDDVLWWIDSSCTDPPCADVIHAGERGRILTMETLEGLRRAEPGDWIIKGVDGEFYPCKPDSFAATYEPVE